MMNEFLSSIRKINDIHIQVKLVEESAKMLNENFNEFSNSISQYDICDFAPLHAAYFSILLSKNSKNWKDNVNYAMNFLMNCPIDKLRCMQSWIKSISKNLVKTLIAKQAPVRGISCMIYLVEKLPKTPEQLTSFHTDLMQLALAAKCFNPVLKILDIDIYDFDKPNRIDGKDYLLYYYYGGMIYAGLKLFNRSQQFFENCMLLKVAIYSDLITEAAKKLVLVTLINTGAPACAQKFKYVRTHLDPYFELSNAFKNEDPQCLINIIQINQFIFVRDNNFGLVKQVRDRHIKLRIKNLTKTFLSMSLSDLTSKIHLDSEKEAEKHLSDMINSKEIFAKISQQDGTVFFLDDPEQYESSSMLLKINEKIEKCINLEKYMNVMTNKIAVSPQFIKHMLETDLKTLKSTTGAM